MSLYKSYKWSAVVADMADWTPGFNMDGVIISGVALDNGSPQHGDKIARNPENHSDRWLVTAAYFVANFEPDWDWIE